MQILQNPSKYLTQPPVVLVEVEVAVVVQS